MVEIKDKCARNEADLKKKAAEKEQTQDAAQQPLVGSTIDPIEI
jgi:hypothetical protein